MSSPRCYTEGKVLSFSSNHEGANFLLEDALKFFFLGQVHHFRAYCIPRSKSSVSLFFVCSALLR